MIPAGLDQDIVLPDKYTEKELEPLRILVFRMKWTRDMIVTIRAGENTLSRYELKSKINAVKALRKIVQHEVEAMADAYGQAHDFRESWILRCGRAERNVFDQTLAVFDAVDVFLNKNNLVRTVSPPEQDQVEMLWQKALEDLMENPAHNPR